MIEINDIFVIYINREEDIIRKKLQEHHLSSIENLKYERFNAIDLGKDDERVNKYFKKENKYVNIINQNINNEWKFNPNKPLSCFNSMSENGHINHKSLILSNLICMDQYKIIDEKYIIILEDDAILKESHIKKILSKLNEEFDDIKMLHLDIRGMGCAANLFDVSILDSLKDDLNVFNGDFYRNYSKKYKRSGLWDWVISDFFFKEGEKKAKRLNLVKSGLLPSSINIGSKLKDKNENINNHLSELLSNDKKKLWIEGNLDSFNKKKETLLSICKNINPKTMLEIGFNSGYSADIILKNIDSIDDFTTIDIGTHIYVDFADHILSNSYRDRFKLHIGKSDDVLNSDNIKNKFDIIFIDGGHKFHCAYNDILLCKRYSHHDTLIIVDDVNIDNNEQSFVMDPTRAVLEHKNYKYIKNLKYYVDGKNGLVSFNYSY